MLSQNISYKLNNFHGLFSVVILDFLLQEFLVWRCYRPLFSDWKIYVAKRKNRSSNAKLRRFSFVSMLTSKIGLR